MTVTYITYAVLGVAFTLFVIRLGRGPTLADRVLALDGVLMSSVGVLLVRSGATGDGAFLSVAVVVTLVAFISTAVIARFIEGQAE